MNRKKTRQIKIGGVAIGGGAPISVQSMTTTPTKDIHKTVKEIKRLEEARCEIVRLGVPDEESARAIKQIKSRVSVPLVADIHFDHRLALISIEAGVDALRINPGNLRQPESVKDVVRACKERGIPIRIGVNSGSINRAKFQHPSAEALVDSAAGHIKILEELDFHDIKVSLKSSNVEMMVDAYRLFSERYDYPVHVGVTEAGDYEQAVVKSSIGIGALLLEGIGDTIRVSITGDVVKEVQVGRTILRSLGLRKEGIEIISCPTCARKEFNVEKAVDLFHQRTGHIQKYAKVAIMGCVVNGPGEASEADIGVAVGRTGAALFKHGKVIRQIRKNQIIPSLLKEIENL